MKHLLTAGLAAAFLVGCVTAPPAPEPLAEGEEFNPTPDEKDVIASGIDKIHIFFNTSSSKIKGWYFVSTLLVYMGRCNIVVTFISLNLYKVICKYCY